MEVEKDSKYKYCLSVRNVHLQSPDKLLCEAVLHCFTHFKVFFASVSTVAEPLLIRVVFLLQLQLCVVHFWLHSSGFCYWLSGSLGANVPLQSRCLHWRESSLRGGPVRLLRQVTRSWR